MKSYKFRLYPNRSQEQTLDKTFDLCRFTYNKLLEEFNKSEKIDRGKIQHKIVELKEEFSELKGVYSKTLQYECYRLFSNLKSLSKRKKSGYKVGKMRFKGRNWFKTIQYNQSGYKLIKSEDRYDNLHLSKIGDIKIRCHREISGNIKHIIIKRKVDSWYAIIVTDEDYKLQKGTKELGIDMGVLNFLVNSDGDKVDNPLFLNRSLDRLKKNQRSLSKKKKGSKNRLKAKDRVIKVYEKIDNQKYDYFHKITTKYINDCSMIAVENLNIKDMTDKSKSRNKYYNMRNILDSSWGKFISMLKSKAESASCLIIEVDPRNTTKMCCSCGNIQDMPSHKRTYKCSLCGFVLDRDYNSAINILNKAKGLGFVENFGRGLMKQEAIISTC